MRISDEVINEIIEKVNIIDVIGGYVKLEKRGKSFFGVCPFHDDTSPSMSVIREKNMYRCFTCGASGNVINFVKEFEHINYPAAVKKVADLAGVTLDVDVTDKKYEANKKFYEITDIAKNFYKFYLQNTKSGLVALEYLYKRGLTQETIDRFEIGLASDSYDYLYQTLLDKGKAVQDMMDCGLVKQGKSFYDLFRERVMFPIHDEDGNVVGFSGRLYKEAVPGEEGQSKPNKYVNSPESVLFKKSEILYNLDKAKNAIKRKDRVLLYEGFMDVISVVNAGIEESVATMGTALSEAHMKKLARLTKKITICYDGDKAGLDATNKTIDLLRKHDFNISVVVMPDGLDPDEYINKYGSEKYIQHIANSTIDVVEFKYKYLKTQVNLSSSVDKETFKNDVFKMLLSFNSDTLLEFYTKKMAHDFGVSITAIQSDYKKFSTALNVKPEVKKVSKDKVAIPVNDMYKKADIMLTQYMLLDKATAYYINSKLKAFVIDEMNASIRYKIVDYYDMYEVSKIEVDELLEYLNDKQKAHFWNEYTHFLTALNQQEIDDCIKIFVDYNYSRAVDELMQELENPSIDEERKLQIGEELFRLKRRSYQPN